MSYRHDELSRHIELKVPSALKNEDIENLILGPLEEFVDEKRRSKGTRTIKLYFNLEDFESI